MVIYTDNNATTRIAPEVYQAMIPYFEESYFNPSSMYDPAKAVGDAIKKARETIAHFLGDVHPSQVLFTSCATESNNMSIVGAARARPDRKHIITTQVEHPAVLDVCKDMARQGYEVDFISVDEDGNLNMAEFVKCLRPDTLIVSIMHANNETGVIFPIEEISRITKETDPSIVFHTDATQTMGKLPIDLMNEFQHVDLLSFSGHKLHAPKGVGALFLRRGTPCRTYLIGGHQESGRRAGTENVPYIVGLAKAVELTMENHEAEEKQVRKLRDKLENAIIEKIPCVQINGKNAQRLPNTLNVAVHYIEGEGILYQLNAEGICASSGSACTSGSLDPSHVLKAMSIPFTAMHGSVRFSLSRFNTEEEVDHIIKVFPKIVANLRNLSPYWDPETNQPRPDVDERIQSVM